MAGVVDCGGDLGVPLSATVNEVIAFERLESSRDVEEEDATLEVDALVFLVGSLGLYLSSLNQIQCESWVLT